MAHSSRLLNVEEDNQLNDIYDGVYRDVRCFQQNDLKREHRKDESITRNNIQFQVSTGQVTWNPPSITNMDFSTEFGSSLREINLSTMMANKQYRTVVGIEISNWTKYHLTSPEVNTYSGLVSMPPVSVLPGHREGMIAHKYGYTMTGSSGIVSWLIKNKDRRVVVVWSSPFFTSNTLAVGLTRVGEDKHDSSWSSNPTQRINDANLEYRSFTYDNAIKEIILKDPDFQICGSMGNSHKPEVKITVRPTHISDLSKNRRQ